MEPKKYSRLIQYIKKILKDNNTENKFIVRLQNCEKLTITSSEGKSTVHQKNEIGFNITGINPRGSMAFAFSNLLDRETFLNSFIDLNNFLATEQGLDSLEESHLELYFQNNLKGEFNGENKPLILPYRKRTAKEYQGLIKKIQNCLAEYIDHEVNLTVKYIEWDNKWTVLGNDGSEVNSQIPHTSLLVWGEFKKKKIKAEIGKSGEQIIFDKGRLEALFQEFKQKITWAKEDKNLVIEGEYPLIIDHKIAKSFAHEILGHSVENDIKGGAPHCWKETELAHSQVYVIDEPIPGEFGYSPVSANGLKRKTCYIIKEGKLKDELTDIFSSKLKRLIGAGRAESYSHFPTCRMSNTRLEVRKNLAKSKKDMTLKDLHNFLLEQGFFAQYPEIIVCLGFEGGECIYEKGKFIIKIENSFYFTKDGYKKTGSAVIKGDSIKAIKSIDWSIGPVITDVIGICRKDGQSILTAGGGNLYTFLKKTKGVKISNERF